jgi:hypothetical protein
MAVIEPAFSTDSHRIHFASNLLEVMLNVRTWNEQIVQAEYRRLWGKRTISYFVFDPISGLFAPSKFCAYVLIGIHSTSASSGMNIPFYTSLDENEKLFDGHRAHNHLAHHLSMRLVPDSEAKDFLPLFESWLNTNRDNLAVHTRGPIFILPPLWAYNKRKRKLHWKT